MIVRLLATILILSPAIALAACSAPAEEAPSDQATAQSEAQDFAARINGTQAQPTEMQAPDAAPQAPAPLATAPAPIPPRCKADEMREFLGRPADDATRQEILAASEGVQEVRFIAPGSDYIKPDPTHPRLNIMIDVTGVIRDMRCG